MPTSIASAPGKVILFGEHAVVYGVTAIAAALSDLRIIVQVDTIADPVIEVNMHDTLTASSDEELTKRVKYDTLSRILPQRSEPLTPVVPTEEIIKSLRDLFQQYHPTTSQGIMSICFLTANILPECVWSSDNSRRGVRVDVKSAGLPIGAGLGSSAAFSVALAASLLRLRQLMYGDLFPPDFPVEEIAGDDSPDGWTPPAVVLNTLNGWAYGIYDPPLLYDEFAASEVVIHGEPSGLDNTTSCFGGAVRLNRTLGRFETLSQIPDMNILLTNTKVPRTTKDLVMKVKKLRDGYPNIIQPILESIEGVSQEFLKLIDPVSGVGSGANKNLAAGETFVTAVSKLFSINHALLCSLGVGHPALDKVHEASNSVSRACKLTGAGGGGCAITLLHGPNDVKCADLMLKLQMHNYDCFASKVGGKGVKWHTRYPDYKAPVLPKTSEAKADMNSSDSM